MRPLEYLSRLRDASLDGIEYAMMQYIIAPISCVERCVEITESICPSIVEKIASILQGSQREHQNTRSISLFQLIKRYTRRKVMRTTMDCFPVLLESDGSIALHYSAVIDAIPGYMIDDEVLSLDEIISTSAAIPTDTIIDRNDGHYYKLITGKSGERVQRVRVSAEEEQLLRLDARRCFEKMEKSMPWYKRWMQEFVNSIS